MNKRDLIIYRIVTGLFSLLITAGAVTYFVSYEMVSEMFTSLGVAKEIIYPLAVAKILGVLALWVIKNKVIKTLAYAGFALDLIFAIIAHLIAADGGFFGPIVPLILVTVSYIFYRKISK
jgi:hypothetical protein